MLPETIYPNGVGGTRKTIGPNSMEVCGEKDLPVISDGCRDGRSSFMENADEEYATPRVELDSQQTDNVDITDTGEPRR